MITLNGNTYSAEDLKGYGYLKKFPDEIFADMLIEINNLLAAGGDLLSGGSAGQILQKISETPGDAAWVDWNVAELLAAIATGQVDFDGVTLGTAAALDVGTGPGTVAAGTALQPGSIVNSLASTATALPLSAAQGKILQDTKAEKKPLFITISGVSPGYTATPNVIDLPNGTALAAWKEGTTEFSSDGRIMAAVRSTAGVWGTPYTLHDTAGQNDANPAFIREGARIYFHHVHRAASDTDIIAYLMYSDDNAITWSSEETFDTGTTKSSGRANGIRLSDGTLIFPKHGRDESGNLVSYALRCTSDGSVAGNWVPSALISNATYQPSEPTMLELEDGHVLAYLRAAVAGGVDITGPFLVSESFDYGLTWSAPRLSVGINQSNGPLYLYKTRNGVPVLGFDGGNNDFVRRRIGNLSADDAQWGSDLVIESLSAEVQGHLRYLSTAQQDSELIHVWAYFNGVSGPNAIHAWNEPAPAGTPATAAGVAALAELTDVGITTPAANQVIFYNYLTGKWENRLLALVEGSVESGGNLTLSSTSHATKGKIFFGSGNTAWYDEVARTLNISSEGVAGSGASFHSTTNSPQFYMYGHGATSVPSFIGRHSGGTESIPTQTVSGKILFKLGGAGYKNTGYGPQSASIDFVAAEDYTDAGGAGGIATLGSYIAFGTTLIGTATKVERVRVLDNGNFGIGTSAPSEKCDVAGKAKAQQFIDTSATLTGSAFSPDAATASVYIYTLNANATINLPTAGLPASPGVTTVNFKVTGASAYTLTFAGGTQHKIGAHPAAITANKENWWSATTVDGGANWSVFYGGVES